MQQCGVERREICLIVEVDIIDYFDRKLKVNEIKGWVNVGLRVCYRKVFK